SGKSTVLFSAATILNVEGGYMYFTETDSSVIQRVTWAQQGEPEQVSGNDVTDATFNGDYCAGYIVYMGKLDGLADAYTLFKKADGPVGGEPVFVGAKITADTLAAPVVTLKNRELKWKAVDRAESYTVYYQASASSAAVRLASGLTELTYTVDDGKYGQYWVEAVGADGVTSASAPVSYGA
ncbi:MAG: hypothetical protein K2L51_00370, partial [Clostridiales bacterium]|nr:hypothetical protein [Clostridiales bacterium]